jgi:serine protease AprX
MIRTNIKYFNSKFFFRLVILILVLMPGQTFSQNSYWLFLKDKSAEGFDPNSYFDRQIIERRLALDQPLFDSADLPLNQNYILQIKENVKRLNFESRWLNAVKVTASEAQIKIITELPFIKGIRKSEEPEVKISSGFHKRDWVKLDSKGQEDLLKRQIAIMQGNEFKENNLNGKGIRIAVLDIGFAGVNKNPVFKALRDKKSILKTWDFIRNHENVYGHDTHGCTVLSCIAGISEKGDIGLAPGAEFLLAITETIGEEFFEEENWLAAMEWAYKNGANIISSSLGYTYHRYYTSDLDGKTSLVSRAGNIAASKGILVINAMGNEGDNSWQFMGTPADADSVLSVGGIDPVTGLRIDFSSFGPTSDMRRKPNVAAFGKVMAASRRSMATEYGTSFSAPLVAGFAACVWQLHPEMTNMQIFHEVERSGKLYPYYDYAHGYGIPQASKVLSKNIPNIPSFEFSLKDNNIEVKVNIFIEDSDGVGHSDQYLYFHIQNKEGFLDRYSVIKVQGKIPLRIPLDDLDDGKVLRVYYHGYTAEYKITQSI